jgi:hypothetical protein
MSTIFPLLFAKEFRLRARKKTVKIYKDAATARIIAC